jgi:acyl-CoA synthetase (NDP forming)
VVWRVAPLSDDEAWHMIQSIKGAKLLRGIRGDKPCDIGAIADMLARLSQMLVDHPAIQEIDINPVTVFHEGLGAQALDARIILGEGH